MAAVIKKLSWSSFLIPLLVISMVGCHSQKSHLSPLKPFPQVKGKLAVAGFRAALPDGRTAGLEKSPFSGAFFMTEPVSNQSVRYMNDLLFNRLIKKGDYNLISPNQVREVSTNIISAGKSSLDDIATIQEIGKALKAELVLAGHLYRWQEREGTEYSVREPASVAFELCLINSDTGEIIWKGNYDKKQQSLAENLLYFRLFFSGKGKWMTAAQLAEFGLSEIINTQNPGGNSLGPNR